MPSTFVDFHGKYSQSPENLIVNHLGKNVSATFCNATPAIKVLYRTVYKIQHKNWAKAGEEVTLPSQLKIRITNM
jgi:hypothetical protein